jgi:hypothetical protein
MDDTFEENIARFLRLEEPATYCDSCLAFTLHLDLEAVRRAVTTIAAASGAFDRFGAECSQCDRFALVTFAR